MNSNLSPEEFVNKLKTNGKKEESKLQRKIQDYLKRKGCYEFKVHGSVYMKSGIPDIIACYKGKFIGIECKIGKNKMSRSQEENRDHILEAGGIHILAYSLEDVKNILEKI